MMTKINSNRYLFENSCVAFHVKLYFLRNVISVFQFTVEPHLSMSVPTTPLTGRSGDLKGISNSFSPRAYGLLKEKRACN